MDETNRVLARLRRIEALREEASASVLLDELRALVPEAEAWARAEGDARARVAATKLREEAEGMR
jgi:Tfp pilus assembly protein PilN